MLGGEQSGHIEAIGFEMYTTMLEEAVGKLKGEGREERPQVTVNLGISLRIDGDYIPEEGQRLRMYKRIAGAENSNELTEVRAELEDRYGKPPESVLHLLSAAEIRLICERLGIALIERKRTAVEEPKKAAPAPPPRNVASPYVRQWQAGTAPRAPLAGRHRQAPQTANLQFSSRAALNRSESNTTRALRETAAIRPANAPLAKAGVMRPMHEMLYVTFSEKLHAAPAEEGKGINAGMLMKLVAKNAKNGAQFTPQGVLKWPLTSAQSDIVLTETRELLELLGGQ
jgi:transcription-repair coupling factor (superfamily II helicase)